jgi:hypothetical protein
MLRINPNYTLPRVVFGTMNLAVSMEDLESTNEHEAMMESKGQRE